MIANSPIWVLGFSIRAQFARDSRFMAIGRTAAGENENISKFGEKNGRYLWWEGRNL